MSKRNARSKVEIEAASQTRGEIGGMASNLVRDELLHAGNIAIPDSFVQLAFPA